jgi:hypothetical protein
MEVYPEDFVFKCEEYCIDITHANEMKKISLDFYKNQKVKILSEIKEAANNGKFSIIIENINPNDKFYIYFFKELEKAGYVVRVIPQIVGTKQRVEISW